MRTLATLAGALVLAGCASGPAPLVENGYRNGTLGLAAIDRGDWQVAEERLSSESSAAANDPARLINLGTVYMATGRRGEAMSAWRFALASERHHMVETRDGRVVSTADLAREAIARHDTQVRSADLGS